MARPLEGRVAVVAGGTRGAGRGISVALGEQGATVYVTGRSTHADRSEMGRPETIEETAALVNEAGGEGIPVRIDHTREPEVAEFPAALRLVTRLAAHSTAWSRRGTTVLHYRF